MCGHRGPLPTCAHILRTLHRGIPSGSCIPQHTLLILHKSVVHESSTTLTLLELQTWTLCSQQSGCYILQLVQMHDWGMQWPRGFEMTDMKGLNLKPSTEAPFPRRAAPAHMLCIIAKPR
eukprot:1145349-Pelagomonas_calceolata.AAC.11